MKVMILAVLLIFLLADFSALRINEVEINPPIGDEWVELYNNDSSEVNLSELQIWEGVYGRSGPRKIKIHLEGIISRGQYYIIDLNSSSILNNPGDFVILYDNSMNKLDETITLKKISSTNKTWQLCDTGWEFLEETKGAINSCSTQTSSTSQNISEQTLNITNETSSTTTTTPQTPSPIILKDNLVNETPELEPIILNAKNIKTQNGNERNKKYAIYGFIGFCILLTILFILKKKDRKNEFR